VGRRGSHKSATAVWEAGSWSWNIGDHRGASNRWFARAMGRDVRVQGCSEVTGETIGVQQAPTTMGAQVGHQSRGREENKEEKINRLTDLDRSNHNFEISSTKLKTMISLQPNKELGPSQPRKQGPPSYPLMSKANTC
jgi:hypothetical protein